MRRFRLGMLGALALAMLLLAGCKAKPKPPEPAGPLQPDAALQLLEKLPPDGAVRAHDIFPAAIGPQTYVEVNERGMVIARGRRDRISTGRHEASIAESDDRLHETSYLRSDAAGNVVMTAHVDQQENSLTLFQPPLVLAFARLEAGQQQTSESAMRIVHHDNPDRTRESGRAVRTMKYASDQRIVTPSGEYRAKCIEIEFTASLRLAHIRETTTWFVVPGRGIVAEQTAATLRVLGTFGSTTKRTIVLE